MQLFLDDTLKRAWRDRDVFDYLENLQGEVYRAREGRRTFRFRSGDRHYFCKLHTGIGWREVIKNFSQGKMPVFGASNEWLAINRLQQLGIDTLHAVAFGKRGWNPARQKSFLVTEELTGTISLEDVADGWQDSPPAPGDKRRLIEVVARIARTMHGAGMNHRDFYLCHLLMAQSEADEGSSAVRVEIPDDLRLYLVDLHRAQMRAKVPTRWRVKDLAGIYFSALDAGLTRNDRLRFLRSYFDAPLREVLRDHDRLLRRVAQRALRLYQRDFGRLPRHL